MESLQGTKDGSLQRGDMVAENKKYYWLKLHKDFFKRHEIRIIEDMANGKDYILFYLKLLVESISHNGNLRFSDTIPYNEQMLSTITNTNVDIVRAAMQIFLQLNMIEMLDDETIYMVETENLIGSETAAAERMRKSRQNKALQGQECNNVTLLSQECHTEIRDKSIELRDKNNITISKDIVCQTETVRPDIKPVVDAWNALSNDTAIKPISKMRSTSKRYQMLVARIKEYSIDDVLKAIEKIKQSDFLKGNSNKGWIITFEWFVRPDNFPKVFEGDYDNRGSSNNPYIRY